MNQVNTILNIIATTVTVMTFVLLGLPVSLSIADNNDTTYETIYKVVIAAIGSILIICLVSWSIHRVFNLFN